MVFVAVEILPVGSKPLVAVVCISKGERHDLGVEAPFSTKMSSLQGRAGSTFTPKLVEHVGSGLTRLAKKTIPMHRFYCFSGALRALANLCVYLHVCLHGKT